LPSELDLGEQFAGKRVIYAGINPDHSTLLVVTSARVRPAWNNGNELDTDEFDLHLISFRRSVRANRADLLLVNTGGVGSTRELLKVAGAADVARRGDAERMQRAFDSLQRISVSSVGVRNTYGATRGTPSYKMFAGSSIESGLRDSDTALSSLGHAMVQVTGDEGAFTAGVSTGKSKYWETRYAPLRQYEAFISDLAERYWFPPPPPSGPLLPQITRGQTLTAWPKSAVLAVTMDYALIGAEWDLTGHGSLDFLDLHGGDDAINWGTPLPSKTSVLPLGAVIADPTGEHLIWTGEIDTEGNVTPTSLDIAARRGHSNPTSLSELLTERPPTVFFVNGDVVRGRELVPPATISRTLPAGLITSAEWAGVDIEAESRRSATARAKGMSVHEWLENYLAAQPRRGKHRWILCNDGPGEIADYIVLEVLRTGQIAVDLWHAKFAGGSSPSVRVTDFEVVSAQAIKSRRWPTERALWAHIADRLSGDEHPPALVVAGNRRQLDVLLGLSPRWKQMSLARRRPPVVGRIGIVQPGLSAQQLGQDLVGGTTSALQIAQLLTVFRDAVLQVADPAVVVSP
jgi:hypothetical protein